MNKQWREALETVGPHGATPERLREANIPDQLLQQLLVAGLLRIDRVNDLDGYGALATQPEATITAYVLTPTGADAVDQRDA